MSATLVTPKLLRSMPLPGLEGETDKDSRGRVLIVAGGRQNPGGALLCGKAAYRAGAGKVQMAAARDLTIPMAFAFPECMVIPVTANKAGEPSPGAASDLAESLSRCDAVCVGPGMMDEAGAAKLAIAIAGRTSAAILIDAGALTGLKGRDGALASAAGRLVFTPHAGEMAALTGLSKEDIQAEPERVAREVAIAWSATVALKGETTIIATPDGQLWRNEGGVSGLGVSGSGDVLAGAITGLLARGAPPLTAVLWGVYVHAAAGRELSASVAKVGFLAREVCDALPHAFNV